MLLFNNKLQVFLRKLKSKWTGPFVARKVQPFGMMEISNPRKDESFKVNGHQLKSFLSYEEIKVSHISRALSEPTTLSLGQAN